MNIYKDLKNEELKMRNNNKGFTLIELIMVTIILGILAAVAVPRYMGTVNRAEAAAENAVLSALKTNAETYASEMFQDNGRKSYPTNPFAGASVDGYVGDDEFALESGDWSYENGLIKHIRNDDSIWSWTYTASDQETNGQADDRGSFGPRVSVSDVDAVGAASDLP
jgi:prepilin-type N-terminal cleavage/methylation domain-containing protein